jgi:hypothetical protein
MVFPLIWKNNFKPTSFTKNHSSSTQFPDKVDIYFAEEIQFGSILGPFTDPLFLDLHCSPILTGPKDGSKRQDIIDLLFPTVHNQSVNMSVSKFQYVGTPFSFKLPTVDTKCQVLNALWKKFSRGTWPGRFDSSM